MNIIEITFAKNNKQTAIIDGKNYEFEFSENELTESIEKNCFELSERSGLVVFQQYVLHAGNKQYP